MTKHTATPWASWNDHVIIPADHMGRKIGGSTNKKENREDFAHEICRIGRNSNHFSADEASANCEFIVRVVNSHDQLVDALKALIKAPKPAQFGSAANFYRDQEAHDKAIQLASAALAAAGEQS